VMVVGRVMKMGAARVAVAVTVRMKTMKMKVAETVGMMIPMSRMIDFTGSLLPPVTLPVCSSVSEYLSVLLVTSSEE
jgi:hypothetical protein